MANPLLRDCQEPRVFDLFTNSQLSGFSLQRSAADTALSTAMGHKADMWHILGGARVFMKHHYVEGVRKLAVPQLR